MSIKLAFRSWNRISRIAVGVAVAMGCATSVWAAEAPPERMTYQGFLVDGNGNVLGAGSAVNYNLIFRIYDTQTGGTNLWGELQTVTVDEGNFSVLLGEGGDTGLGDPRPALSSLFTGATASERYISVTVKGIGAGGADVEILPRLRLVASPYAFMASKVPANSIGSAQIAELDANKLTNLNHLNSSNGTPALSVDSQGRVTVSNSLSALGGLSFYHGSLYQIAGGWFTNLGVVTTIDLPYFGGGFTGFMTVMSVAGGTSYTSMHHYMVLGWGQGNDTPQFIEIAGSQGYFDSLPGVNVILRGVPGFKFEVVATAGFGQIA